MIAYIIMYVAVVYGAINNKNVRIGYFVWGLLFFFSAFRGDEVGTDTMNNLDNLYIMSRASMDFEMNTANGSVMEWISNFVFRIVDMGANPRIIIFFFSSVTFLFLLLLSKGAKIDLSLLMMVFLFGGGYLYSFNIARQWAAIAVSVYATTYIYESNFKKSLLFFPLIILASGIHFFSFFYSIIYVIRYVHLKILLAISIIVIVTLLAITLNINVGINTFFNNILLGHYIDTYGYTINQRETKSFMGWVANVYFLIIYIIMMTRMPKIKVDFLIPLLTVCIIIGRFTESMESVIHRAFMFFSFILSVIFAYYLSKDKGAIRKMILYAYLLISSYLFFTGSISYRYSLMFNIF